MKDNQNRLARFAKDAGKALLAGLAVSAVLFVVLFVVGFVMGLSAYGAALLSGLDLARRGLFIVGALALLVSAGALLMPEKAASVREKEGWNAHFERFGLFGVLFCAAVVILAVGGILDALLFANLL